VTEANIPTYVYHEHRSEKSLLQGDILKVTDKFRQNFIDFYPAIKHPDGENKYAMVLTQSCDLVKTEKRKPKLNHLNVCLVRSLKSLIERIINDEIRPTVIGDKKLLLRDALDRLKDKLSKLLNNSELKTHFFLPKKHPFNEDMVAILPLSFSFRTEHYELLLANKVLELKPDFQAKVGHTISQLYGRIGTPDLSDFGWDDKKTRTYINNLLRDSNLAQVPDRSFIEHIKSHSGTPDIEKLIKEYEARKVAESFQPAKNELLQNIKSELVKLFADTEKINQMTMMSKKDLSKEIAALLQK
jgi:hypothetical protein